MKIADIDPAILEWLCAHEAMRRIGFAAADLYFAYHPSGVVSLVLLTQGKVFAWTVGNIPDATTTQVQKAHGDACAFWIATPDDDEARVAAWKSSIALRDSVGLLIALQDKGFDIAALKEFAR